MTELFGMKKLINFQPKWQKGLVIKGEGSGPEQKKKTNQNNMTTPTKA